MNRRLLLTEAASLARRVNDPAFHGDRWETSMRLSHLMRRLGAMGIDSAAEAAEGEEECNTAG